MDVDAGEGQEEANVGGVPGAPVECSKSVRVAGKRPGLPEAKVKPEMWLYGRTGIELSILLLCQWRCPRKKSEIPYDSPVNLFVFHAS